MNRLFTLSNQYPDMMRYIHILRNGDHSWITAVVANVDQLVIMCRILEASPECDKYEVYDPVLRNPALPHIYGWGPDDSWPKWVKKAEDGFNA